MVRSAQLARVSNHEAEIRALILRDAAERPLLGMRVVLLRHHLE